MTRPTVHLTTTRPIHGRPTVEHPLGGETKVRAWLLNEERGTAHPLASTYCADCGRDLNGLASTADVSRVNGDSRYGYELHCGPRTPGTCGTADMAYFDPLPKVSRVTKASKPRASERDSEWETKNSRSRKQNKRSKGGRKAQERDYA